VFRISILLATWLLTTTTMGGGGCCWAFCLQEPTSTSRTRTRTRNIIKHPPPPPPTVSSVVLLLRKGRSCEDENEDDDPISTNTSNAKTMASCGVVSRRGVLRDVMGGGGCGLLLSTNTNVGWASSFPAASSSSSPGLDSNPITITTTTTDVATTLFNDDDLISSLTYQRVLGQGAYKTVYLVGVEQARTTTTTQQWALAVEKVTSKSKAKNALYGIQVANELQDRLTLLQLEQQQQQHGYYYPFEQVHAWWFQSTPPSDFETNRRVFRAANSSVKNHNDDRTQRIPHTFRGRSKWLLALKPVYEMDFQRFMAKSPSTKYAIVGGQDAAPTTKNSTNSHVVAGIHLSDRDTSALRLAYQLCEAGRQMHAAGLIHRDIKPKNIMLSEGRPILIDFGFSDFASDNDIIRTKKNTKTSSCTNCCIHEPGKIKGDKAYMLAEDAAVYQSCQRGDTYAMGKTFYEVLFSSTTSSSASGGSSSSSSGSSTSSSSSSSTTSITTGKTSIAAQQEAAFRYKLLASPKKSRGVFSSHGRDLLLDLIRGLCRKEKPFSFQDATEYLVAMAQSTDSTTNSTISTTATSLDAVDS
jgi:serine/threonine protein kinase